MPDATGQISRANSSCFVLIISIVPFSLHLAEGSVACESGTHEARPKGGASRARKGPLAPGASDQEVLKPARAEQRCGVSLQTPLRSHLLISAFICLCFVIYYL